MSCQAFAMCRLGLACLAMEQPAACAEPLGLYDRDSGPQNRAFLHAKRRTCLASCVHDIAT